MFFAIGMHVLALCLALTLASCSSPLRQALDFAGDNAAELQAVLDKYEAEGDGEKLAAAEFLIANMRLHGSKTSVAVDSFAARMLAADTLTKNFLTMTARSSPTMPALLPRSTLRTTSRRRCAHGARPLGTAR